MNDYFVRDRIQQITGLTKMAQRTGIQTSLGDNVWTTIYFEENTSRHIIMKAYKISLGVDVTGAEFRILAAPTSDAGVATDSDENKTFPFGASTQVLSGVDMYLDYPLQVPKAHEFYLQVRASGTGLNFTATLDYLSIILIPELDLY